MLSLWNPFLSDILLPKKSFHYHEDDFKMGLEYKKNDDNSLSVSVDLPGVSEEGLTIELASDNVLSIKAERKTKTSSFTLNRSFSVPEKYDVDQIDAELKNGVLTLTLPLRKPAKDLKETKKIFFKSVK